MGRVLRLQASQDLLRHGGVRDEVERGVMLCLWRERGRWEVGETEKFTESKAHVPGGGIRRAKKEGRNDRKS